MPEREFLIDVSRLVWRAWRGGLPTGIDRVCLAYVEHFGSRAHAVVQRRGVQLVLSPSHSDRLFRLLLADKPMRRLSLVMFWTVAGPAALRKRTRRGAIYLNVGHTGLNESSLPAWIARHRLRAVYLIHDLIPLTHPQFCRPGEEEKHRRRMENVLISGSGLIGNSGATVDEVAAFARSRELPMPPSIVAWISGHSTTDVRHPRFHSKPYFVTVGTIEGRKNHQLLLDVWRRLLVDLGDHTPELLIVGQRGWQAEGLLKQLDNLGQLQDYVRELGTCEDEELAAWISGARALLMPSFAEGFGLPVVEALRFRTPVIVSDLPVFREIVGDIPTYVDPSDADSWKDWIQAFTGDTPERNRQLARMAEFRPPEWNEHFAKVEEWFNCL